MIHKMMYARFEAAPGQVQPATGSWTVPAGVYAISAVAVGANAGISRGATKLVHAGTGDGPGYPITGNGGGYGGAPGSHNYGAGASGGNGGYTGNGGNGGYSANGTSEVNGVAGGNGAGGGGGGGGGGGHANNYGSSPYPYGVGGMGAGVGLNGLGTNGTGGPNGTGGESYASNGGPGSDGSALPGATIVPGPWTYGAYGLNLAWANNIAVTPGEVLTINNGANASAVRIIWGGGRSYPSNAGSV